MLDFKPPKDNPVVIGMVKAFLPVIFRYRMKRAKLRIIGDGLERFKALNGQRTVLCPNHADNHDPEVMFALGKAAGEDFNYLAAREVFDYYHGLNGILLQNCGVYSVVRGAVDRESFKTTRRLIVEGRKKLVIFPEGEISHQNDTLMPLESGVPQMTFWALDELKKKGEQPPVFILPMAIKYTYSEPITQEIDAALTRLEDHLGHTPHRKDTLYKRLRVVAESILQTIEAQYAQQSDESLSMNERIDALRTRILQNVASYMQVDLPEDDRQLEWIRILRNSLDDYIYENNHDLSAYEKKVHSERARKIKGFYRDIDRVVNFIAIYDGYLKDHMTQERFADVINRFEKEVFGIAGPLGARDILLKIGKPINLTEKYDAYKKGKRQAIRDVNNIIEEQISTMLQELENERSPIFVD